MSSRFLLVLFASQILFGQNQRDLQGIWTNATITPLERSKELGNKQFFTPAEAAKYERDTNQRNNADQRESNPQADVNHAYNQFWWDRGSKVAGLRTSLIIDPPDGRIPPLTPAAQERMAAQMAYTRAFHRWSREPLAFRTLFAVGDSGSAHAAEFLQQRLSDRADAQHRGDRGGDDP